MATRKHLVEVDLGVVKTGNLWNYSTCPIKCVVKNPPWEMPTAAILDGSASPISMTWSTAASTSLTSCGCETIERNLKE